MSRNKLSEEKRKNFRVDVKTDEERGEDRQRTRLSECIEVLTD